MKESFRTLFERGLWSSRVIVYLAVIASVLSAFALFCVVTFDFLGLLLNAVVSLDPKLTADAHNSLLNDMVKKIITIIDVYLLGAFMLVFGFGLYELFLGELTAARESKIAERILRIESLDDLKVRLGKIVLIILIVEALKQGAGLQAREPRDLLYLTISVALIALALYLTHSAHDDVKAPPRLHQPPEKPDRDAGEDLSASAAQRGLH